MNINFVPPQIILGKVVSRPAKLDPRVARKLVAAGEGKDEYETVLGKTISTDDFYEGQVFFAFGPICTVSPIPWLFFHTNHRQIGKPK